MKKIILYTILSIGICLPFSVKAQPVPTDENALVKKYPFVSTVFNRIFNNAGLDSFYQRLYQLKNSNSGVVSIVHIGDSHIQPDFLSGVVRTGLQKFFGNAGRGLVFPYQLALSNAPSDITSSSPLRWEYNRVAHPEIPITAGISGFAIKTANPGAQLTVNLRQDFNALFQDFDRLTFFLDDTNSWMLQPENAEAPYLLKKEEGDTLAWQTVLLNKKTTGFSLAALPSDTYKAFYGVSLENSAPGILYHSIGVNGARYDQYNNASLFWQQLPALNASLYIVSLGTNEAQRAAFNEPAFIKELDLFIEKIKTVSPRAEILITTAPDSYKGRYSNKILKQLNQSLTDYCNKRFIPLWDLYRITNGFGSAYNWSRRGLMSRDRIHFTADGYRLQGDLLFHALAKGYNNYISILPPAR